MRVINIDIVDNDDDGGGENAHCVPLTLRGGLPGRAAR